MGGRPLFAWPLLTLVWAYQRLVSPLFPPVCRYFPSCSAYAVTALTEFGAVRGTWLAVCRVARCHPWAAGGYDPVPGTDPGGLHTPQPSGDNDPGRDAA
ncbi:membrane protein insertion efficiency factor YidD [Kytococcus sp. Marseille-QA3725]